MTRRQCASVGRVRRLGGTALLVFSASGLSPVDAQTVPTSPKSSEALLADFVRAEALAKSGGNPIAEGIDPFIGQLANGFITDWPNTFRVFRTQTESISALYRQAPPEQRLSFVLPWVEALGSVVQSVCADDACRKSGLDMLARWKGLGVELLGQRPQTVMPGSNPQREATLANVGSQGTFQGIQQELFRALGMNLPRLPSPEELAKLPPDEQARWQSEFAKQAAVVAAMDPVQMQRAVEQFLASPQGKVLASAAPTIDTSAPLEFLETLRPDEVLVDVYRVRAREGSRFATEEYVAAIAGNTSFEWVSLGRAGGLQSAIDQFNRELRSSGQAAGAARLVQSLLQPIRRALPARTRRVWISPDADLSTVPWGSLALLSGWNMDVAVVTSAFDVVRLRRAGPDSTGDSALLVGNLTYATPGYARLPATVSEIANIASLATRRRISTTQLTGADADLATVLRALATSRYVHLATHGEFLRSDPSSPFSFGSAVIALSGASGSSRQVFLTAEHIRSADLSGVELITLSACDSGIGRPTAGQGMLGFQTAFMSAGVKSVLVSLWPVPDQATAALMTAFYRELWAGGKSASEALRLAQSEIRTQKGYEAPLYWAAWVLVGKGWP